MTTVTQGTGTGFGAPAAALVTGRLGHTPFAVITGSVGATDALGSVAGADGAVVLEADGGVVVGGDVV